MSQKTIQFNPQFLSMSGSKSSANKTLKRERKEKPLITMNPNKVKKQLIDKIKTFQLKEKENDLLEKTKEEAQALVDASIAGQVYPEGSENEGQQVVVTLP